MQNRKGFTLVEVLVVVTIISLLVMFTLPKFDQARLNSEIDTVEADLRMFALDINNYNLDFGGAFIDDCDDETLVSDVDYKGASENLVYTLNTYLGNKLDVDNINPTRSNGKCRVSVKTQLKKDPWGSYYNILIDAKKGNIIIVSPGPNKQLNTSGYVNNDYDDDIMVIVRQKQR